MPATTETERAALEQTRRGVVSCVVRLLDLQAETGSPSSQLALDTAIEAIADRLLSLADRLHPRPERGISPAHPPRVLAPGSPRWTPDGPSTGVDHASCAALASDLQRCAGDLRGVSHVSRVLGDEGVQVLWEAMQVTEAMETLAAAARDLATARERVEHAQAILTRTARGVLPIA